jgi:hypothetical protein
LQRLSNKECRGPRDRELVVKEKVSLIFIRLQDIFSRKELELINYIVVIKYLKSMLVTDMKNSLRTAEKKKQNDDSQEKCTMTWIILDIIA